MSTVDQRANNFDFVRFLAAFLVIWGHSAALLGLPITSMWGVAISEMGVMIFFVLSGYLITESWLRDPRLVPFFLKRSLRIFPALIVCVIICACLIGPIVTSLPIEDYFFSPGFAEFFKNIALLPRYSLPGVFEQNTYRYAVNGSLWTLPVEFFCYCSVAALAVISGRRLFRFTMLATVMVCGADVYFSHFYDGPQIVILDTGAASAASIMPFFFVGSIFRLVKDRISLRIDIAVIMACATALVEYGWPQLLAFCTWLTVPYITLTFCLHAAPLLSKWGRFGDFSYGMYLYAFPVQQSLIYFARNDLSFGVLCFLTTVLSLALAWCSWHLIERRALMLKPGRSPDRVIAGGGLDRSIVTGYDTPQ
ncbi:acyltransferase family protein [Phyllobacterium bourgognense]|uniref:Peptidoglycan/LPS O-acetylase OafA/YrhL n=1 Tax=Phyllobacterium bourgognense TaxID=314236 RepID=A0A368YJ06_9HYPH|nr:acyltransferase [Phyllobacterium bourgognense]RCW80165.1 peptidoglycan/LPS O-acetylase OafA/YrhL [Phyllobacterium bourgognense]